MKTLRLPLLKKRSKEQGQGKGGKISVYRSRIGTNEEERRKIRHALKYWKPFPMKTCTKQMSLLKCHITHPIKDKGYLNTHLNDIFVIKINFYDPLPNILKQ